MPGREVNEFTSCNHPSSGVGDALNMNIPIARLLRKHIRDQIVLRLPPARPDSWSHIIQVKVQLATYGNKRSSQQFRMPGGQIGDRREIGKKVIETLIDAGIATIRQTNNLSHYTNGQFETDSTQIDLFVTLQFRKQFIS